MARKSIQEYKAVIELAITFDARLKYTDMNTLLANIKQQLLDLSVKVDGVKYDIRPFDVDIIRTDLEKRVRY